MVFVGVFALIALIDYIEMMRRDPTCPTSRRWLVAKTSLYRVPQIAERIMPFSMLIGAMSCYLDLSRRLELVVARAAGMSAWQFVSPALIVALILGVLATLVYNPIAAALQERSKRLEVEFLGGNAESGLQSTGNGFWVRQKSDDGQSIINALTSSEQGVRLGGVTVFTFDRPGHFLERIEAKTADLGPGAWRLSEARIYSNKCAAERPRGVSAQDQPDARAGSRKLCHRRNGAVLGSSPVYRDRRSLRSWGRKLSITVPEAAGAPVHAGRHGAAGGRVQSLRFFRFGGVQKMVLSGVGAGFLLYVLSKVTEDLSKAELMHPIAAAWLPVCRGRPHRLFGLAVPGGRVMAASTSRSSAILARRVRVAARWLAAAGGVA